MLKIMGNFLKTEDDENMKHGWQLKRQGGWLGGAQPPPLFANKMIYMTPASLDGLTKTGGGSVGTMERNEMICNNDIGRHGWSLQSQGG